MTNVTQARYYCVWKFSRDVWQSWKLGPLCFASIENNGSSKRINENGIQQLHNTHCHAGPWWSCDIDNALYNIQRATTSSSMNKVNAGTWICQQNWSRLASQNCFSWANDHWTIALYRCSLSDVLSTTELIITSFIEPLFFVAPILAFGMLSH